MAGEKRTTADRVIDRGASSGASDDVQARARDNLVSNGRYYEFSHIVATIERLFPDAVKVGTDGPPSEEIVWFRHDPSLSFSTSDVTSVEWVEVARASEDLLERPRHRFEVTTTFLGLTGSATPLPLFLAEEVAQADDVVQREFLDIFHHRLISLLYRLIAKHDLGREFREDGRDAWSRRLLALAGIDAWAGAEPRFVPVWRLLRLAPLLASSVRSARVLELAIQDVCGEALGDARVTIEQFTGQWSALDDDQRMALGARNNRLGDDAVLGSTCFHRAGGAVIRIGPLGESFRRFLTDGDMYPVLIELTSMFSEEPIDYALELVLSAAARPPFRLGHREGGRIGVDAWLSAGVSGRSETRLRVPMSSDLPRDPEVLEPKWQSHPQRWSR